MLHLGANIKPRQTLLTCLITPPTRDNNHKTSRDLLLHSPTELLNNNNNNQPFLQTTRLEEHLHLPHSNLPGRQLMLRALLHLVRRFLLRLPQRIQIPDSIFNPLNLQIRP